MVSNGSQPLVSWTPHYGLEATLRTVGSPAGRPTVGSWKLDYGSLDDLLWTVGHPFGSSIGSPATGRLKPHYGLLEAPLEALLDALLDAPVRAAGSLVEILTTRSRNQLTNVRGEKSHG